MTNEDNDYHLNDEVATESTTLLSNDELITTTTTKSGQQYQQQLQGTVDVYTNCNEIDTTTNNNWFIAIKYKINTILYPDDCPCELYMFDLQNIVIPLNYLLVGISDGMLRTILNVYPLDLNATESQQAVLSGIATLPAAFKLIYGFISDSVPIAGYRRKPYMYIGWLLSSTSMLILHLSSSLSIPDTRSQLHDNNHDSGVAVADLDVNDSNYYNPPTIPTIGLLFFLYGLGMWISDVMADAVVAQKVRLEPIAYRGTLQSTCYACRFFGLMCSAPVSTWLYSKNNGPYINVLFLIIIPLLIQPFIYTMVEDRYLPIPTPSEQVHEIWNTICSRSVWQPIGYLFLYNVCQIKNAAWKQFLRSTLHFSTQQLNIMLVVTYIFLYLGTMVYKYMFLNSNWRHLYQTTISINFILSIGQILLITGQTFGINQFLFALGDDAAAEFISSIQFLPSTILMVTLCPPGSEGASYAMFTAVFNSAQLVTPSLSTGLLRIWDVSKTTLIVGQDMSGMIKLTILTAALKTFPILFLFLLPKGRDELLKLSDNHSNKHTNSPIGGTIFLIVLFGSMIYMATVTMLNIIHPGWSGET